MQLPVQPLTPESFTPYGQVIQQPSSAVDATGPGWRWWGETVLMAGDGRPFGIGYLELAPADPCFDWAERHMHSVEVLIPTGDCLVYVGPPDHLDDPKRLPRLDRFVVFSVRKGQGVLLERGVWHGAPLAIDRPLDVVVLLLQGTGATDVSLVRFDDTPVHIDL